MGRRCRGARIGVPRERYFGDTSRYGWQGPNYTGRGPRGYQRTDERIR